MPGSRRARHGRGRAAGRAAVSDMSGRSRRAGRRLRVSGAASRQPAAAGAGPRGVGGRPWRRSGSEADEPAGAGRRSRPSAAKTRASARTALLARIDWPGKPGSRRRPLALTAGRTEALRGGAAKSTVNICMACHQAGRSRAGQARAEAHRIATGARARLCGGPHLLNGKEGPGRADAAARRGARRRAGRRSADVHPPRVGSDRFPRGRRNREGDARPYGRPHEAMEGRRARANDQ